MRNAAKESEQKYKQLIKNSFDMIVLLDSNGIQRYVSESCERILGYKPEELINISVIESMVHPDDQEKTLAGLTNIIEKSTNGGAQYRHRHKNGSWVYLEAFGTNQINNPLIKSVVLNVRDITESIENKELILKSKQLYDNLVSNISVGVYVLRSKPDGSFVLDYVSPKMAEILDLSVERLITNVDIIFNVFHPDDLDGFVRLNREGIEKKQKFYWQGRAIVKGVIKWLHFSSIPQEEENGDILWNGLVVDITDQMKAKAEIEHQNEELHKMNVEKDKFFSIIAHDLKAPFNSIVGFSNLLSEQVKEKNYDGIVKYSGIIEQSSNHAMDLLKNLMEWSLSHTGRMKLNPEYFELIELIKDTELLLTGALQQKSISLSKNVPANTLVFTDKAMISTVLRNLISNAIKYTHSGDEIIISTKETQEDLTISVSDKGVGIPKENINKLFKIDQSYSTLGTNNEKGTGLGLILCKEFIEMHRGQIWVESVEGKGSNFKFTLPKRA